jgi:hypothetical protein
MEPSPSSEVTSCTATQDFPNMLWNPKFRYHVNQRPQLVFILNKMNSVHIIPFYFSKIHFNIVTCEATPEHTVQHAKIEQRGYATRF